MKTLFLTIILAVFPVIASADRVALVIGNSGYKTVPSLANPLNDASDIAQSLKEMTFDVDLVVDADLEAMRSSLERFVDKARDAELSLVYFAGHGIEVDGSNYLIPTDADLKPNADFGRQTLPLIEMMTQLADVEGVKIVLIDACRDNPFAANLQASADTRSIGQGLTRVEPVEGQFASGILVGYAAKAGTVALDGTGRNSPYAEALLEHMARPELEVSRMFRLVRDRVFALTDGRQEPFTYGSLPGRDIFLTPVALREPEYARADQPFSGDTELTADVLLKEAMNTEDQDVKVGILNMVSRLYPHTQAGRTARALSDDLKSKLDDEEAKKADEEDRAIASETALGLGASDYRQVQRALNALGFNVGVVDGVFGPRSRAGLMRYQENIGLSGTGFLTANQVAVLKATPVPTTTKEDALAAEIASLSTETGSVTSSSAQRAESFVGQTYCLVDKTGVWNGRSAGTRKVNCMVIKSISDSEVRYDLFERLALGKWLIHRKGTFPLSSYAFPNQTTSYFQLKGKKYERSEMHTRSSFIVTR